ncbi:MAG TPA: FAD-binding oxidoreductase [Pseudonocardia sp.]|nr:FAD-binding oxidoreductase [Pseudonocardia sp.]
MAEKGLLPDAFRIGAAIHLPAEPGYELRVAPWNQLVRHAPALVVAARDAEDVVAVVRLTGALGERIRVQATGHGALAPATGGVLIDTSALDQVRVDPEAATAVIGAGARWRDVVEAAAPHGLAPLSGSTSQLGAVGFCLGGGKGWLVRRYGLAADSILAADIVTADGQYRRVDADTEPDLFWALRGGGPNFGVVTGLTIRLVPAGQIYAGGLYWSVEQVRPVLAAFRELTSAAPAELTAQLDVLHLPPDPTIPEPMRGSSFVRVTLCSVGDPDTADRLLAPLRAVPGLLLDEVRPMAYREIDSVALDPVEPLPVEVWTGVLDGLSDDVLEQLARRAPRDGAAYLVLQLQHVGGGHRPAEDRTGLAHWTGEFVLHLVSVTPGPEARHAALAAGSDLGAALSGHLTGYVPLNFFSARDRIETAFRPAHLDRLREIKHRYDPLNVFGGDRALVERPVQAPTEGEPR